MTKAVKCIKPTLLDEFTNWFLIEVKQREIYPTKRVDCFNISLFKIPSKFVKHKEHSNRYSLLDEITEYLAQHNWTYKYSYFEKSSYKYGFKVIETRQIITFKRFD